MYVDAEMDDDDPQLTYITETSGRMCELLGSDFVPYLQHFLPLLVGRATSALEPQLIELEDDEQFEAVDGWEEAETENGEKVGINYGALDDAAEAIQALGTYVEIRGGGVCVCVVC
jgi:hypothetical protein